MTEDEAEELADNVVIVDQGAVIAEGSPTELIAEGASETLEVRTVGSLDVAALPDLQEVEPGLYQLIAAPTPKIIAAVASEAARQGVLISSMGTRRRSLEDVFLDLTGRELRA